MDLLLLKWLPLMYNIGDNDLINHDNHTNHTINTTRLKVHSYYLTKLNDLVMPDSRIEVLFYDKDKGYKFIYI
jgi:hypothetical protein